MTTDSGPTSALDDTVHQRHRLGIMTILSEADRVEFSYLQTALELTPGNLNRHLAVLEEAGLVSIDKEFHGRKPKTWVRITRAGSKALSAEIAILTELVTRHARPGALPGSSQPRTAPSPA